MQNVTSQKLRPPLRLCTFASLRLIVFFAVEHQR